VNVIHPLTPIAVEMALSDPATVTVRPKTDPLTHAVTEPTIIKIPHMSSSSGANLMVADEPLRLADVGEYRRDPVKSASYLTGGTPAEGTGASGRFAREVRASHHSR
jgi:hypothetical protein